MYHSSTISWLQVAFTFEQYTPIWGAPNVLDNSLYEC